MRFSLFAFWCVALCFQFIVAVTLVVFFNMMKFLKLDNSWPFEKSNFYFISGCLGGIVVPTDPKQKLQFIPVDSPSIKIATRNMLSIAVCRLNRTTRSKSLRSQWRNKQTTGRIIFHIRMLHQRNVIKRSTSNPQVRWRDKAAINMTILELSSLLPRQPSLWPRFMPIVHRSTAVQSIKIRTGRGT